MKLSDIKGRNFGRNYTHFDNEVDGFPPEHDYEPTTFADIAILVVMGLIIAFVIVKFI